MARWRAWRAGHPLAGGLVLVAFAVGCGGSHGPPPQSSAATEIGYSTSDGSSVIGPDGSAPRTLSTGLPFTGDADPRSPQPATGPIAVSPDGANEAYWRDCDRPTNGPPPNLLQTVGLWTAASNGRGAHRIWAAPSCYIRPRGGGSSPVPRWNSIGTELAIGVSRSAYTYAIVVVHADGKDAHYLAGPNGKPLSVTGLFGEPLSWSPAGKYLAFVDENGSIVVAPVGGGRTRVVADLRNVGYSRTLSWSPDGRTILASVGIDGAYRTDVEAFPASGGTGKSVYRSGGQGGAYYSPDGKQIVLTGFQVGLRVANADGTGMSLVPGTTALGFSVDVTSWFRVPTPPGPMAPSSGYWVASSDNRVASFGSAYGGPKSPARAKAPITAIMAGATAYASRSGVGYELVAANGELVNAGNVVPGFTLVHYRGPPIIAVCGNDFVSSDGNFYLFGTDGSTRLATAARLTAPVIAAGCALEENLIFAADGTVYRQGRGPTSAVGGFTDKVYAAPGLTAPIVGAAADRATGGYWLVGRDGNVYGFNAPVQGSLRGQPLSAPVIGIASDDATGGYWIVTADGVVHGFNAPVQRQTSGPSITSNVIGMAAPPLPSGSSSTV